MKLCLKKEENKRVLEDSKKVHKELTSNNSGMILFNP